MRRVNLALALCVAALLACDAVLLAYGRRFLAREAERLERAQSESTAGAARAAVAEAIGEAVEQLVAREARRSWREYAYLYVPSGIDLSTQNLPVKLSPLRDLEPSSLVRARFTLDAEGRLGSPWRAPAAEALARALGDDDDLTELLADPFFAEKSARLDTLEARAKDLAQASEASVPPASTFHDVASAAALESVAQPAPFYLALEEMRQGNVAVQQRLDASWMQEQQAGKDLRNYYRNVDQQKVVAPTQQQVAPQAYAQQEPPARQEAQAAPRARANDAAPAMGVGDLRGADLAERGAPSELELPTGEGGARVHVSAFVPVVLDDAAALGGRRVFYVRRVVVEPWLLASAAPAFQGFELDGERALAAAEEAAARQRMGVPFEHRTAQRLALGPSSAQEVAGARDAPRAEVDALASSSMLDEALAGPLDADVFGPPVEVRLPAPFDHLTLEVQELRFRSEDPLVFARILLHGAAAVIAIVGVAGAALLGRLVWRQTELARRRTDFVAAVSHELKAPLSGIRALAEMLVDGLVPSEERRRVYHASILHESERLSRIVQNVLDVARLERGGRAYDVRVADPTGAIRESARAFAERLAAEGASLTVDLPERLPEVPHDRDALVQAVQNLVDNAAKYGGGGAGGADPPRIRIAARAEPDGSVLVEVEDDGPGIPEAERRSVFEPFYRGAGVLEGAKGGAGLGLAIARRHLEGMGGRLDLAPFAPGRGARFCLHLGQPSGA